MYQWYFHCSSSTLLPFVSREKYLLLAFLKGFTNEGNIRGRLERGKTIIWNQLRPLRESGYGPFQVHPVAESIQPSSHLATLSYLANNALSLRSDCILSVWLDSYQRVYKMQNYLAMLDSEKFCSWATNRITLTRCTSDENSSAASNRVSRGNVIVPPGPLTTPFSILFWASRRLPCVGCSWGLLSFGFWLDLASGRHQQRIREQEKSKVRVLTPLSCVHWMSYRWHYIYSPLSF